MVADSEQFITEVYLY